MEMLGIMRETKSVVFQPQYAQCLTAKTTLPQTYDYNLQYQNTSTASNVPNKITVNSPTVSDALFSQSSDVFRYLLDKTIMKKEYSEFFLSVPQKAIMNKMFIKNKE